jgi:hypothetical protein
MIAHRLLRDEGVGDWAAFTDLIRDWFGQAEAQLMVDAISAAFAEGSSHYDVDPAAEPALLTMPLPLFLTSLEWAVRLAGREERGSVRYPFDARDAAAELNRILERHSIHFSFDQSLEVQWTGDRGAHREIIGPALEALADERFAGARDEFEAAMRHIRAGAPKDREDAIEEAAKSVESAMKSTMAARRLKYDDRHPARKLWEAMKAAGLVEQYTEPVLLGPSLMRNRLGGHGSGEKPRQVSMHDAEVCVRASANALLYLHAIAEG